jgi:acyl-CoA synthetase (AMP-forming)/AMP-acid ligase II
MEPATPPPWLTIPAMLEGSLAGRADVDAVVDGDGDVRLTYRDLQEQGRQLAAAMQAAGIGRGDRVAIWAPNQWQWPVVACATWYAGAVLVPISTRFGAFEAGDILTRGRVKLLFAIDGFLGNDYLGMLRDQFGDGAEGRPYAGLDLLADVVVFGEARPGTVTYEDFVASGAGRPLDDPGIGPDDLAEILFTSGTTGQPKGVQLAHGTLLQSYTDYGHLSQFEPGHRYLAVLPFGHGGGLNGCLLTSLIHGLTDVPIAVFDPAKAVSVIEAQQITILIGPPAVYNTILNSPELADHDVSSLEIAFIGAATVPPKLIEDLRTLGVGRVINAYGCIETCVISMTRADDPAQVIIDSAGRALPGMEIRIVDEDGQLLPVGEVGTIHVRGVGIMTGYVDPEQTKRAIDADRWFNTGDMGFLDKDGNVKIVDRRADMFHVGGFNVYPAEVEAFLLRHDAIDAVAVIGREDPKLGHLGLAYVVRHPGTSITAGEINEWAKGKMANYKVPREYAFLDALPLNPTGKIDKLRLREMAATVTIAP